MNDKLVINIKNEERREEALALAKVLDAPITKSAGEELTVIFDEEGVSLSGYGMSYMCDFDKMIRRINKKGLHHEMLVRVAKTKATEPRAIDATAGMGEDSIVLAAYGYDVTMFEQNPVVATLLKDGLRRASLNPELAEIAGRMHLIEGDSVKLMDKAGEVDLIYLDPMFPERQKSSLVNKKLQLIQKLEQPCSEETALFEAALAIRPSKIVVKRPLKGSYLADKKPSHSIKGKAIRYDCFVFPK